MNTESATNIQVRIAAVIRDIENGDTVDRNAVLSLLQAVAEVLEELTADAEFSERHWGEYW